MESFDVVVIGAGLAGLRCAIRLAEEGRDVVVLEASDRVGGRQRTDEVDGFLIDRGFQVLNPAYPAVKRWVDLAALDLRPFPSSVDVHRGRTIARLAHPVLHPRELPATLRSGLVHPRELIGLARWVLPALIGPRTVLAGSDRTLREGWNRARFHGALRTEVLEPFLAGVIADDSGATSDVFTQLLARTFALGRPSVPAAGIAALPAQLAAAARALGVDIRVHSRVSAVRPTAGRVAVEIADGDAIAGSVAVVAVGPDVVADLVDLPRPGTRGLQTWWFETTEAPSASRSVRVDGRRSGPVVNSVIMSHTAPSYAPPGRHLIEATCLLAAGTHHDEVDVRRQLSAMWHSDATSWRLVRRDDIPDALPAENPPVRTTRHSRVAERVFVAGDHRDTASIQGALVSGDRAAQAVLASGRSRHADALAVS